MLGGEYGEVSDAVETWRVVSRLRILRTRGLRSVVACVWTVVGGGSIQDESAAGFGGGTFGDREGAQVVERGEG
jgi:hypothetical protein